MISHWYNMQMADNARRSGFEGFFVLVGNCINEDSGLGHVSVTPGAENVSLSLLFTAIFIQYLFRCSKNALELTRIHWLHK